MRGVIFCVDGICNYRGKLSRRLQDADCDFTAVGDKQAGYAAGWRRRHARGLRVRMLGGKMWFCFVPESLYFLYLYHKSMSIWKAVRSRICLPAHFPQNVGSFCFSTLLANTEVQDPSPPRPNKSMPGAVPRRVQLPPFILVWASRMTRGPNQIL
jgi:hypothetical protein